MISTSSGIMINSGHLLENLVFIAIRRNSPDIHYYKTNAGREIDFIVGRQGDPLMLIQVSETLKNLNTRRREITSLTEAMSELNTHRSIIVTRLEEDSK